MWMGQFFKALYLVAFSSFLRISNLVSHKIAAFSPLEQFKIIKLPVLQASPLCPVKSVKNFLSLTPGSEDTLLFQIRNDKAKWLPLTDTKTRRNFTQVLQRLGLKDSFMSLHTFRRSGATLAFNSNVSLQNIQSHGTLTFDRVWRYITQDHDASQELANAFQSLLSTPTTTS